jgi:hypothetical protein
MDSPASTWAQLLLWPRETRAAVINTLDIHPVLLLRLVSLIVTHTLSHYQINYISFTMVVGSVLVTG